MTNTPAGKPLWSDERIDEHYAKFLGNYHTCLGHVRRTSYAVRDDYEAELATLRARIAELEAVANELKDAKRKIARYEEPLPLGENGRYTITCDHRFTDEGTCIRCGEDAEEWDAGCVEQLVNEMTDLEAEVARLKAWEEWEPVEYHHIYTPDAKPINPSYGNICGAWHWFYEDSADSDDGYEYAICRRKER